MLRCLALLPLLASADPFGRTENQAVPLPDAAVVDAAGSIVEQMKAIKAQLARLDHQQQNLAQASSSADPATIAAAIAAATTASVLQPLTGRLVPNTLITPTTFPNNPLAQVAHVWKCADTRFDMFVHNPADCRYISKGLLEGGWECHMIDQIAALMGQHRDEYFMDIGSNIGSFSLTLAHAGAKVLAFEAMQYNAELQSASLGTLLPPGRQHLLRLFHAAVAPVTGGELCVHPVGNANENKGNGQVYNGPCRAGDEAVPRYAIDDLMAGQPDLSNACVFAVKADVEGYEALAFQGAKNMFTGRCPPCAVFMEYQEAYTLKATGDARAAFHVLEKYGYTCALLQDSDYKCAMALPQHAARCGQNSLAANAGFMSCPAGTHVYHSGSHCCRQPTDVQGRPITYTSGGCGSGSAGDYIVCPHGEQDHSCHPGPDEAVAATTALASAMRSMDQDTLRNLWGRIGVFISGALPSK